jgi:hypothetical protein
MNKPRVKQLKTKAVSQGIKDRYKEKKLEYLELCWHYHLEPGLLSLRDLEDARIIDEDRHRLIRLIIVLSHMERTLGPSEIPDHLFAADEFGYANSQMFGSCLH